MYSYPQYAAKATVAMPKPGKLPLNRFHRVKGPVYRHASLFHNVSNLFHVYIADEQRQRTLAPMDRLQELHLLLRMLSHRSPRGWA